MELKIWIFSGSMALLGLMIWYFGYSQQKAEKNEGVGFVDPEFDGWFVRAKIGGKLMTLIGVAIALYHLGKHLLG